MQMQPDLLGGPAVPAENTPAIRVFERPPHPNGARPKSSVRVGREVLRDVASRSGVATDDILGRDKGRRISHVRQRVYLELRQRGWSYGAIGVFMNRDHTTVQRGCNAARQRDMLPL